MKTLADIESAIDAIDSAADPVDGARRLLELSEEVLEHWIAARDQVPTLKQREGFRLLALHRQGATGDPSFNACRETCREIVYHYNLLSTQPEHTENPHRLAMMQLVSNHLFLFISGKLQVAQLGEFCCSAKPLRLSSEFEPHSSKEA